MIYIYVTRKRCPQKMIKSLIDKMKNRIEYKSKE